jgi:cytochrome c551/c552
MQGGSGVWGSVSMPAQQVSAKDAAILTKWVLSQR